MKISRLAPIVLVPCGVLALAGCDSTGGAEAIPASARQPSAGSSPPPATPPTAKTSSGRTVISASPEASPGGLD